MIIKPARRTLSVQEYYFSRKLAEIASMNEARKSSGLPPVINLGIGAPDGMPPEGALEALNKEAAQSGAHIYQNYHGIPQLREAFASWYGKFYGVQLDPTCEIQPLVGSKEGILLLSLAFLDKGDKVLVPDPGYPTYTSASKMVEAQILTYDLVEERGWMPDFDHLEAMDLDGVKLMWVNYPHMPTGARATKELFSRLVDFGRRHSILIVNDNPYSCILTEERLSLMAVPGAMDCCMELNSLSKAYNMSGWRLGMICGSAEMIGEVLKVKTQMDSGIFRPLQMAAVAALGEGEEWFSSLNASYRERREVAGKIFSEIGAAFNPDSAGLFLWGRVSPDNPLALMTQDPQGSRSLGERVSDSILYKGGVFITPGFIFGKNGENYIRISLCAPPSVLNRSLQIIQSLKGE